VDATTLLIISIKCGKSCICVTPRPIHECIRNLTFFYTRGSVYKPPVPYVNHLCNFHRFSQVAHIKNHLQKFWLWNLWKSFCIAVEFAYKIRIPINGVFLKKMFGNIFFATRVWNVQHLVSYTLSTLMSQWCTSKIYNIWYIVEWTWYIPP